jgi:hypothetical protein
METLSDGLMISCFGLTCYMAGVEWLTQLVNFPMLNLVGQDDFPTYQASITRRIVLPIVIPGLLTSILAILLIGFSSQQGPQWIIWLVVILELFPVVSTITIQLPRQKYLSENGFSPNVVRALMLTQWLRTIPVTLAACILMWLIIAGV